MLYTDETGTANTLAFNETSKGFTSFYSFKPEIMLYSDNRLYSFKNGHLYLHDDASADINTFYGTYYPSKINVVINQEPSEIKVFQAINIEGTGAWDVVIKAFRNDSEDFSQSTLVEEDFTNKEGRWYSTIKRNEVLGDKSSKSIYGLGEVSNISGDDITIDGGIMNSSICAGDEIYNTSDQLVGVVESVSGMVITLTSPAANIVVTDYVFGKKDDKIEGSQIRGYNAILEMETDSTANRELYAVNTKVFKSYR